MSGASDAGLAIERTSLAWQRTSLAYLVAGTILARALVRDPGWVLGLVLCLVVVGVGTAWLASVDAAPVTRRNAGSVLTICTLLMTGAGVLVVLLADPR